LERLDGLRVLRFSFDFGHVVVFLILILTYCLARKFLKSFWWPSGIGAEKSLLGCVFGFGLLHRIPSNPSSSANNLIVKTDKATPPTHSKTPTSSHTTTPSSVLRKSTRRPLQSTPEYGSKTNDPITTATSSGSTTSPDSTRTATHVASLFWCWIIRRLQECNVSGSWTEFRLAPRTSARLVPVERRMEREGKIRRQKMRRTRKTQRMVLT